MNPASTEAAVSTLPSVAPAGIVIPFQVNVATFKAGSTGVYGSWNFQSSQPITERVNAFMHAEVVNAEAVVFAGPAAIECPASVRVAWVPAQISVPADVVMSVPRATSVLVGAPGTPTVYTVPADFRYMNRVFKDPIPYTNHAKLVYTISTTPACKTATEVASLVVRGELLLSHPTLAPF